MYTEITEYETASRGSSYIDWDDYTRTTAIPLNENDDIRKSNIFILIIQYMIIWNTHYILYYCITLQF